MDRGIFSIIFCVSHNEVFKYIFIKGISHSVPASFSVPEPLLSPLRAEGQELENTWSVITSYQA